MSTAIMSTLAGIWAAVVTVWKVVDGIMQANKDIIQAVVLRVQKDTADGTWTTEEKEQEVVDIMNNYVKPKLPWYMNLFVSDDKIREWVRKACEKAAGYKGTVSQ